MVKWKFWYYIAPAYPAFAIVIAGSLLPLNKKWDLESNFRKFLIGTSLLWIFIANYFPIPLHLERAQEVMDFKENILQSDLPDGPIWYIHCLRDHNILGTSGRWYFKRDVIKVSDAEEENWAKEKLKSNSFVMMDKAHFNFCREGAAPEYMKSWCSRLKLIQTSGTVALTVYE